ncbi:MAG: ANTAR domain-containing protein [Firmicutes bacterium]|nr:ANTAR domain-containing protein [Bacillota bacterium]
MIESVLIVAQSDNAVEFLKEILQAASIRNITAKHNCADARQALIDRDFDLVIINAPLTDETGERLAKQIAARGASQVILVVKLEHFDAVAAASENDGVLCVPKPINRTNFWAVLSLAKSSHSRLLQMENENAKLKRKIEDIRIIDRAKCAMIEHKGITEQEAHRYIEKQSMDKRISKRDVAIEVLEELGLDANA